MSAEFFFNILRGEIWNQSIFANFPTFKGSNKTNDKVFCVSFKKFTSTLFRSYYKIFIILLKVMSRTRSKKVIFIPSRDCKLNFYDDVFKGGYLIIIRLINYHKVHINTKLYK